MQHANGGWLLAEHFGNFDAFQPGPMGIAVNDQGRVFVSDWGNRVQVFASDGAYLGVWGSHGTAAEGFEDPVAVLLDGHGHVYVAEHFGDRVQAFRLLPPFAPK